MAHSIERMLSRSTSLSSCPWGALMAGSAPSVGEKSRDYEQPFAHKIPTRSHEWRSNHRRQCNGETRWLSCYGRKPLPCMIWWVGIPLVSPLPKSECTLVICSPKNSLNFNNQRFPWRRIRHRRGSDRIQFVLVHCCSWMLKWSPLSSSCSSWYSVHHLVKNRISGKLLPRQIYVRLNCSIPPFPFFVPSLRKQHTRQSQHRHGRGHSSKTSNTKNSKC